MKNEREVNFFMLEALCGNKNVSRILLFLFVNGKCYGTQLHRSLMVPLTPLQKALNRLEKGGVVTSYYEGKTRLYQFNPAFPLLSEMEQLLKKAYTLLPANEKKIYYVVKEELMKQATHHGENVRVLFSFWEKLLSVTQLTFHAKTRTKEEGGWNGKGRGEVVVTKDEAERLIFHEKGTWQNPQGEEVSFHNVFRWTLNRFQGVISLEHLRYGIERPVFLFQLAPAGQHSLLSVDSHLCEGDTYFGQIHFNRYHLRFNWRVIGPKKNEEIDYHYS